MNCAGPNLLLACVVLVSTSLLARSLSGTPRKRLEMLHCREMFRMGWHVPIGLVKVGVSVQRNSSPLRSNRHVHCHVITALDDPSWTIKSLGDYRVDLCIWSLTCRILEDLIPPGRKRSTAPCKSPSASTAIRSCSQGKVDN